MSSTLVNIIVQLIGGAIGGNALGGATKNVTLGTAGNTIAGAVACVAGGSLLMALIPILSGAGGVDIRQLAGQIVGGGATGAIVTAIVGAIVNNKRKS